MKVRTDLRAGKKGKRTKPEDRPHVEDNHAPGSGHT